VLESSLAPHLRRIATALLVLWVTSLAYLTLIPGPPTVSSRHGFLCLACGSLAGSDLIRNWILFLPGGFLATLVLGRWRAVALGVGLTTLIELAQLGIPRRDPALQDLLLNSIGALSGAVLASRGLGRWARTATAFGAAIAWAAPLILLVPKTTPYDLYGQWTPSFRRTARYPGRILDASVGGLFVPSRRVVEKAPLDSAVLERHPIRLLVEVGPAPEARAPIFQIVDGLQNGILELHGLGPDLVLRGWNPARILKLDQPDTRWAGAMGGVGAGDTVTIVVDRGRESVCMSVEGRERCDLAPSLADGWGFLMNLEGPPLRLRRMMSVFWAVGLGGLIGLVARSWRQALAFATALAVVGYAATLISPDVRPSLAHAGVLVLGALIGALLQRPVVWLWRELRPTS
jgi:hypothetical protein